MKLPMLDPERNTYLLFDTIKINELIKRVVAVCSTDPMTPIYAGTKLQEVVDASPLLIHVTDFDNYAPLFKETDMLTGCLIIQSSVCREAMIKFWQSTCIAYFRSGHVPAIFRLHDPELYEAFQQTEHAIDKIRLAGPCEQVWIWNRKQERWDSVPQVLTDNISGDFQPIELSDAHMEVMTEVNVRHGVQSLAEHITTYFPHLFEEGESSEPLAKFLFVKSSELGFIGQQSLFFFANIWCYLGADCLNKEKYPEIANKLSLPSSETPQQRVHQAALMLENYKQNLIHRQHDYI
jgi:hypothetical protein